jgi:hypothetical protein
MTVEYRLAMINNTVSSHCTGISCQKIANISANSKPSLKKSQMPSQDPIWGLGLRKKKRGLKILLDGPFNITVLYVLYTKRWKILPYLRMFGARIQVRTGMELSRGFISRTNSIDNFSIGCGPQQTAVPLYTASPLLSLSLLPTL